MKTLIVTQDFPPDRGGIQTYALELARHLPALGHEVHVLCPAVGDDRSVDRLFPVTRLPVPSSFLFAPLLGWMPSFVRRHRFTNVVYCQWQSALWEVLSAQAARPHTSACLVHGRELLTTVFGPATPLLLRRVMAGMQLLFPVSHPVRDKLLERTRPRGQVRVVHPGVDAAALKRVDSEALRHQLGLSGRRVIVTVGRLAERKNLKLLLSVLPSLRRRFPDLALVLGGTGPERDGLERSAARLGVADMVHFVGRVPDQALAAHLSLGDVFVLCSRGAPGDMEGFGIAAIEAGACEVPVVATAVDGIVDAVLDGKTGRLIPDGDGEALETALAALLEDPQQRRQLGRQARQRIQDGLTWQHTAAAIAQSLAMAPAFGGAHDHKAAEANLQSALRS